jgi:hypothetical protein
VTGQPSWTQLTSSGTAPSARESSTTVYDSASNSLIAFAGDAGGNQYFGDIWVLSNANGTGGTPKWSQLTPSNQGPSVRSGQSAIYDSQNDRMTIYGGYNGDTILSDVWILSGASGHNGTAPGARVLPGNRGASPVRSTIRR